MFEDVLHANTKEVIIRIAPAITPIGFYMAGGTGLALQMGHRISEDLDFFKTVSFDPDHLLSQLKNQVSLIEDVSIMRDTLLCLIEGVKCSFFSYDVPLRFHEIDYMGLKIADWRDIIAEKVKAISQRGSKKDFYDIYFATTEKHLSIQEVVTLFKKRFGHTNLNLYHVLRSLTFFEDAEGEPDPILVKTEAFSWEEVKIFFIDHIKEFEKYFIEY
ncbi:MAG: nucleotidyl transferase AbiEii/AbiGii toxin family protein [Thermodesulfobacteriota bacterium]